MSTFYTLLTTVGEAKLANATALGQPFIISQMAVGDANGNPPTPSPSQTTLINELRRAPLNTLDIDPNNTSAILAEQVIPETVGGWWIRELGLYDADGDLVAVGNCPPTYKPLLTEGSGRTQVIRMLIVVSNTAAVTLKVDPSIVLATRAYVSAQVLEVSNALQAHKAATDPHTQYAKAADVAQSQAEHVAVSQFLPWNPARIYRTGETCTTIVGGELKIWEMYAGPNLTSTNKDPNDSLNRHDGWLLDSAPFWWIEYGNIPGRPSWWLAETAPERAVMEMGQDLPTAVYWRLARQYPALVNGVTGTINTGDIRGEFLRVWDNGRGVDVGRTLGSSQGDLSSYLSRVITTYSSTATLEDIVVPYRSSGPYIKSAGAFGGGTKFENSDNETRPRNIARAMIIEI